MLLGKSGQHYAEMESKTCQQATTNKLPRIECRDVEPTWCMLNKVDKLSLLDQMLVASGYREKPEDNGAPAAIAYEPKANEPAVSVLDLDLLSSSPYGTKSHILKIGNRSLLRSIMATRCCPRTPSLRAMSTWLSKDRAQLANAVVICSNRVLRQAKVLHVGCNAKGDEYDCTKQMSRL